jgi:hypothetical protein
MTHFYIVYVPCLIGGVYFIWTAFTIKGSLAPHWIRTGLIFAGSLIFLLGATGSILLFYGRILPKLIYRNLAITHYMLIGASLSLLVFLFISGALSSKRKTDDLPPTP